MHLVTFTNVRVHIWLSNLITMCKEKSWYAKKNWYADNTIDWLTYKIMEEHCQTQ